MDCVVVRFWEREEQVGVGSMGLAILTLGISKVFRLIFVHD